jgi:hypothetical protein
MDSFELIDNDNYDNEKLETIPVMRTVAESIKQLKIQGENWGDIIFRLIAYYEDRITILRETKGFMLDPHSSAYNNI